MRLEKIVLDGFKSFADKTEFAFDVPITAIVGPNGCGKSNIADAIKWVLGEQSVKSLRSGQMADVIFSGSSSRKPMGTAEVTLFISGTSGQLPIEADEVQISRRIYKSGESEYRINNKVCRLKDVRELFMDTGVSTKAYSIIEQGQVEQLLTASKTDRRIIFEEAAGISKYKAHKKEALRKLERTDQNLLRLADILGEIQKQLRSVKLQAGKARNYLRYTQRLKELQVNYSLVEYARNQQDSEKKNAELAKRQEEFAAIAAEVSQKDVFLSNLGQEIIETENQINEADNCLVGVQGKIEQHFQRIEFLKSRITELEQRKATADVRTGKLQAQEKVFEDDLLRCQKDQMSCEKQLEEKSCTAEQLQKSIHQINAECASVEAQLEDEKSGIIDIVRRTAQLHNEVQSISVYRDNLSNQKHRLSGRADTAKAQLEQLLAEKAHEKARCGDIEKVLCELTESLEIKRKAAEEICAKTETDNRRLSHSKEARSALSSELSVLTDMENNRQGLNNAVKTILQHKSSQSGKFDYVEALLADIIVADIEYAAAVESALEGKTDALVVSNTESLLCDRASIEKLDGRASFICTDRTEPFVDNEDLSKFDCVKGRLVEFIKYDGKYGSLLWSLLGKTIVVDCADSAIELSGRLGKGYQFVSLNGEFVNGNGIIKVGQVGRAVGLISRKSRLRQLSQTIANINSEIATLEKQIDENEQTKRHLEQLCKELRTAIYEATTEQMQLNSKLDVTEQNIKRLAEEQPLIASEIGLLEEQIAKAVQKEYESKQQLEELETVNNQRTLHIKELEAKYAEQKTLQESKAGELTELRVYLGQAAEQNKALKQTIESLQNQIQANEAAVKTASEESERCSEQSAQSRCEILKSESLVSQLYVEKEKSQDSSGQLHKKVQELLEEQRQTEQLIREKRAEQSEVEQKLNELKVKLGQLEVKQQSLVERVQQELQIDLAASYENYTADENQVDWDAVREEITELRGKIERLGNVNLDAIDQQEELSKRNEFLSSQVEDLQKSKGQLQQLIIRLNKKSREKFIETFEEIRVHFQQLFRKLFGGGKADILLEDAEDILEAGIEIIARPPGKETRSISLLSGGEKTMTAISLLFAVFKAKPSPFCLLDEVDAALDEANNERFNLLIREFVKVSQFIIITHAKRTMSLADMLYGITMQTRGVSKKISVRFDQFDEIEEQTAAVA